MRPGWDDYFLRIAKDVSTRATCLRRQVGAILVRNLRILTTGYNGPPAGIKHCADTGGCLREKLKVPSGQRYELCKAIHAEVNAILQGAIHGVSVADSILYCTEMPCSGCAKLLINVGVKRIVIPENAAYADELSANLLLEAGVTVERQLDVDKAEVSVCGPVSRVRRTDDV